MPKFLFRLLSRISYPREPVYKDTLGYLYIEDYSMADTRLEEQFRMTQAYQYRELEQSSWGWWSVKDCWLGVHKELPRV